MSITQLDAFNFPLFGARLIEASAGTGKTFTICSLYLRLLLGHGSSETKHQQPLTVDKILVVTFTDAATSELRSRIRSRIRQCRIAMAAGGSNDQFINALIQNTDSRTQAKKLLLEAERNMDKAAIYTIHGFCQKMLAANAFESGADFNSDFLTDESETRLRVVSDYWRRHFYPLKSEIINILRQQWSNPQQLLQDINPYLSGNEIDVLADPLKTNISDHHKSNLSKIESIKDMWNNADFDIHTVISQSGVNKRSYTKANLPKWIEEVSQWSRSETIDYTYPKSLSKFSSTNLAEKATGHPPRHTLFDKIDSFITSKIDIHGSIAAHAITECRKLLIKEKKLSRSIAFDDLLTKLNNAVIRNEQSLKLAHSIAEMYPIAMIDEFQDTDPIQYSIFSAIYKIKELSSYPKSNRGIFLIGDPKQAIYAFRGADIYTYIKAKSEVENHYTLNTNWRSTAGVVESINTLFKNADSPFLFNGAINYPEAKSALKENEKYYENADGKAPAMTLWLGNTSDSLISKGQYSQTMADATVNQISYLLHDKRIKKVAAGQRTTISESDIAVLVRTGAEARIIQTKLSAAGIRSIYLSSKDSVFNTPEAQDIYYILLALNEPHNHRAIKPALSTSLIGTDAKKLAELDYDERAIEGIIDEFNEFSQLWDKSGILPALNKVLASKGALNKLLLTSNGERILADVRHIGELLQQASLTIQSKSGLIRWLADKIESPDANSDEQRIRLDSENDVVKIVTIHKSKGLEYNFVFAPFLSNYREANTALFYNQTTGLKTLDLYKSPESMEASANEILAEDLRLLYVALTRAVYGCFIGIAALSVGRKKTGTSKALKSGIGWILQNGTEGDLNYLEQSLIKLQTKTEYIVVGEPPKNTRYSSDEPETLLEDVNRQPNKNNRNFNYYWQVTSFTALTSHSSSEPRGLFLGNTTKELSVVVDEANIFNFPRGAKAGTFLHTIFERTNFPSPESQYNKDLIKKLLEINSYDLKWQEPLQKLVSDTLNKPLGTEGIKLKSITPSKMITEMEFNFPVSRLQAYKLQKTCARHDKLSTDLALSFTETTGLLKGFIDLVFEHKGKFYILDWKSNHLGDSSEHYDSRSLETSMKEHKYTLQYQIYSVALHKYLQTRLQNYSYEQHFGGVLYLFLRGINENNQNGVFETRPTEMFIKELESILDDNK